MSRKDRKFKGFFRPKLGDLQKKKKKRSSPKFSVIFRPKSKIQTFFPPKIRWSPKKKKKKKGLRQNSGRFFTQFRNFKRLRGGSFCMGGAIFHFSQKIGLKSTKNMLFCILHKPMGGARAPPPPPWLRYCWHGNVCRFLGFCPAAISYFNHRLTDWYFFLNTLDENLKSEEDYQLQTYVNCK